MQPRGQDAENTDDGDDADPKRGLDPGIAVQLAQRPEQTKLRPLDWYPSSALCPRADHFGAELVRERMDNLPL
jgi:hypothetical protein